jgi:uncharacterized protein
MAKTERIRDPIHDLIVFEENDGLDQTAWALLESREFQRLRRIKQLGVTEFVYPGATHSRFAHSVGVFHNARQLLRLIKREINMGRVEGEFDERRAQVAVLAALLHDIGHGPFSHAFEEALKSIAEQRAKGEKSAVKKHEIWTAEIVENKTGQVFQILSSDNSLAQEIADLLRADTPTDMYHAIVSSSFDADRLDYLRRDRYMTGTGVGAIDFGWLLDNVRVASIDVSPAGGDNADAVYRHSFCLSYKARDAAEDFLLARYRLYTNVYLHKTTRGIEQLLSAVFRAVAEIIEGGNTNILGISNENPVVRFLSPGGETLENYLALDDTVVWAAIGRFRSCKDRRLAQLANRLWSRETPLTIDIQTEFPNDSERQRRAQHRLDDIFKGMFGGDVFKDDAKLNLYGEIGADDAKAQQRLMIQLRSGDVREITNFTDATVAASDRGRRFLRYYFLNESDYNKARTAVEEGKK